MSVLLIDDNAYRGWQVLLEKSLNIHALEVATNYDEAKDALGKEHQLIFLDMRLSADEKNSLTVDDYASYRLIREVRLNFSHLNFSTPIILFSASSEAWKVRAFLEMGVDAVYTKEHPRFGYDPETSKMNFTALKDEVSTLKMLGEKKRKIWALSSDISHKIENHTYTKKKSRFSPEENYQNVKKRINDKIKLAYKVFFSEEKKYEHDALFSNSSSVGEIIYFSISEEITKLFTKRMQNLDYHSKSEWEYRNGKYLINEKSSGQGSSQRWVFLEKGQNQESYEYPLKAKSLSNQMYGLIHSYAQDLNQVKRLGDQWHQINSKRNENNFIHSDTKSIYNSPLVSKSSQQKDYISCTETLKFYLDILNLPVD